MFDLHVHAAPSLFPRSTGGVGLAQAYRDAGASGFLLKHHHGSSVEAAATLNELHPSLTVLGGVVLNMFVGGVNAYAVDAAVATGARMVWLPTIHAAAHEKACGCLGGFTFQQASSKLVLCEGIDLLDEDGKLWPQVFEVLEALNGTGVALGTGHVGREELFAVHAAIHEGNYDIPLVINHVFFDVPKLPMDDLARLHSERTYFEIVELSTSTHVGATTDEAVAAVLNNHPDWNWVLASDGGQAGNDSPPARLRDFMQRLAQAGIPESRLEQYVEAHPRTLLNV